jgi:prephenate dehydratase
MKKIAIQGVRGSFHHIVSHKFFKEEPELLECDSFDLMVKKLNQGECDGAVMALENSIAGSILPNHALIDSNDLLIQGERYLDIQMNMMALPGQTIADITEVHSHPIALLQCKLFFDQYPHIKLVEADDTADVARDIKNKKIKKRAAIGSLLAAEIFDLHILAKSIQTIATNQTRFVLLSKTLSEHNPLQVNKASFKFELNHQRGSLASILNVMSDCNLNLTKIQSLPKIDTPWTYGFFADVTFDTYQNFEKAIAIMKLMAKVFKVMGVYQNQRDL